MTTTRETKIIDMFNSSIDDLMEKVEKYMDKGETTRAGNIFADEMAGLIRDYHVAAFMAANDSDTPDEAQQAALVDIINEQSDFAFKFAEQIKDAESFSNAWTTRAKLYSRATRQSYQAGKVFDVWDLLPASPGDCSTVCCNNCDCRWDIRKLKGNGNYNCYWKLGTVEKHCPNCKARAAEWKPLKIRDGKVEGDVSGGELFG